MSADEWMTWDEAAERLGIKVESVQRRARARRWGRMTGNDGRARVLIPPDVIPPDRAERREGVPPVILPDQSALTERAIRAEARADAAEVMLKEAREDRDRWRGMAERLSHRKPAGILSWIFGSRD